jgi:hypothetical protein
MCAPEDSARGKRGNLTLPHALARTTPSMGWAHHDHRQQAVSESDTINYHGPMQIDT